MRLVQLQIGGRVAIFPRGESSADTGTPRSPVQKKKRCYSCLRAFVPFLVVRSWDASALTLNVGKSGTRVGT